MMVIGVWSLVRVLVHVTSSQHLSLQSSTCSFLCPEATPLLACTQLCPTIGQPHHIHVGGVWLQMVNQDSSLLIDVQFQDNEGREREGRR